MDKTRSLILDQLLGLKNKEMILEHSQPIQEQIKTNLEKINYYFHIFTILEWMKLGVLN